MNDISAQQAMHYTEGSIVQQREDQVDREQIGGVLSKRSIKDRVSTRNKWIWQLLTEKNRVRMWPNASNWTGLNQVQRQVFAVCQ